MKMNNSLGRRTSMTSHFWNVFHSVVSVFRNVRSWVLFISLLLTSSLMAQQYCLTTPIGYGRNATGGGNATPTLVDTESELKTALGKSGSRVIIITDNITVSSQISVEDGNFTLLALPGKKLINLTQNKDGSGIINVKGCSNVIIRNVTFEGPGAYDCDGRDLLQFDGVTNAWVDHCDFQDGCDGNFDNKGNTDNITVSWCRFRYLKKPKAGGSGGSDDHRYTNLVGSNASDKPSDGRYNITWAYCWWDEGCVERMTRCRNADLHFLNCYWNSSVAKCYIGPEKVTCYLDGCTMEGSISTANRFKSYNGTTNSLKSVGCSGVPSNTGSVDAPSYSYTALSAAEAKTAVTNTTCGAGATLNVSVSGSTVTVLSPCASTPCTISFNSNGGAGTMTPQSAYEDITTVLKANTFTRSGYAFQGWATSAGSSTVAYADKASVTPTGNMTLYAVWKVVQTYTLTFNANGGTCGVASLTYTDGGAPLTMPVPTLDGKVCTGWFTAASGGTKIASAGATYTPTATQTLYAQWTDAPPCFVPGTATLGSGTTATLADGTKVTMESCTVSETNISVSKSILFEFPQKITAFSFTATCGSDGKTNYYKLNGGSNVALASSTTTAQTYEIPISGDVTSVTIVKNGTTPKISEICYTLTGSSSTYTVTYETNGGNSIAQVTGVTKLPNPLPTPTKSGATFDGWYTNAGLTIEAVAGSTINENTTLYAKWTPVITGDVTYTADNSIFPNPERGFYEHVEQTVTTGTNSSNLSDSYFTNGKAAGRSLILRLYYLNNFRETATLTQSVIDLINTDMQKLRDNGFKCILRFAYTNTASDTPSENKDGSPEIWEAHLAQLKSTLAANADVIYVVQAGFLGAWGEWYYSSQGKGENISITTKNNLINQLLDAVPASRVVQLRTPKFKTDYLGSNAALTSAEAYKSTAKARLGHHNDAFLNGDENQGTYEDVTEDKAYIAQECLYVPVGGETNHDEGAATINTHATGDKAVAEMAYLHYSYLNQGYSTAVTDLWRSTGHFDIMSRNLGYRFQLQAGTFSDEATAGGTMAVNMTLKNVGYAPLYYERPAYIVLKNATNTYSLKLSSDPRSWQPNGATTTINENLTIPASVASGTYNLYLHLPDASASLAAKPAFAVRFANTDIWESATGYNKLNAQIVVTGSGLPTYVVTFDANGHGTAPTAQTVVENATATEPAALTASGYTFGGWYKEAACNNKFDFSTLITENITLYAKWTEEVGLTPTPCPNSGHVYAYNDEIRIQGGTYRTPLGNEVGTTDGEVGVTGTLTTTVTGLTSVVLNSCYSDQKGAFPYMAAYIKAKTSGSNIVITVADGYSGTLNIAFGAYSGSKTTKLTNTYADATTATVTSEAKSAEVEGAYTTKTVELKSGTNTLTFSENNAYISHMDVVLNVLTSYTLSYNLNGHGATIADATVSALPNPLPTPSEAGWTFGGWYTDETLTVAATPGATINANTTLYAKWTEEVSSGCATYLFFVNADDAATAGVENTDRFSGTATGSNEITGSIDINGTTYDVTGRNGSSEHAISFSVDANKSVTFYMLARSSGSSARTLTLKRDGLSITTVETGASELQAVVVENLTEGDYELSDATGKWQYALLALYECSLIQYNLTYSPTTNGAISGVTSAANGVEVTLTATPDAGYVLDAWTVKDAADNAITVTDNKFTMPASDVTVTATFRELRTYTVKFDGNGATGGAMTDQTGIQEGVATPLTANTFTFGTKIFNGWNTMSDGSGTAYADGASVTLTDVNTTLTLYAQWKDPATYTVTFNLNGKTGTAPTEVTVTEGEKITKPTPDPEVTGYTFGGWYKEPACTNAWNFDTDIVTNTTTLYAKWTKEGTLGCNTTVWWHNADDATANDCENSTRFAFSSKPSGSNGQDNSMTIDGITYTATKRSSTFNGTFSFTIAAGKEATLYLCIKRGGDKRVIHVTQGSTTHKVTLTESEYGIYSVSDLTSGEWVVTCCDDKGDAGKSYYVAMLALHECQLLQYNITYLPATNGTISGATSAAQGMEVTLTATPDAGYVLDNVDVYKSDDPTVKVTPIGNQFTMPAYDVTVAPTFRAAEVITIAYDANGGQGTMASQTVTEGQVITLSTNTFTHDDPTAIFAGWNTKADGTGIAYTDGQSVALIGNTTLYAQWNFGPCFSMEFLTSGSITSQTYLNSTHATITQGTVFYDRVEEGKTMDLSDRGVKFGSKDDYLKVTLGDRVALAAGTKITMSIYTGSAERGMAIYAADKTTKIGEVIKTGSSGALEATITITDVTINENVFYITSAKGNTSYLKSIIIENCGDYCPELIPVATLDYVDFCSTDPHEVDVVVTNFVEGATLRLYKEGESTPIATKVTYFENQYRFADIQADLGARYYVEAEKSCITTSASVEVVEQALSVTPLAEGWYIKDGRIAPDIELFKIEGVADSWTVTTSPALTGAVYTLGTDGIVRMSGVLDINAPQEYLFTLNVNNGCVATPVTSSLNMHGQIATTKPTLAFVTIGAKDAADTNGESGFTQGIDPDQSTNLDLYKYLLNPDVSDPNSGFNITAVNAYATADEAKIRAYYSQFDLVLVTDYPDTNEKGEAGKSYINAIGSLLDVIPILSMETFLAKQPNWQINSEPDDPEVKQDKMTLLCPSHDVFADIGLGAGDIVKMFTEMGEKGMQGFVPLTAPDYMFIATIDGGSKGDLITCCERQVEVKARMIMLGLNYTSMESITDDGKKIVNQMLHYLLRKNADDVADCSMTFTNGQKDDGTIVAGSGDNLWSNPKNWGPTYNMIPTPYHNVRIEKKCIVDVPNAHASLIKLRKDATTVPTNPKDGSVIINANGGLSVVGKMVEVRGKNFITTYPVQPADLYIKADATGNGALAVGGNDGDIRATVDFFSKARDAGEEKPVWQYVGAPFSDMERAIDYYRLAWMCRWTEEVHGLGANWEWVRNEDNMQPFRGYCITHVDNTKTYTFTGKLNASTNRVIQLTANGDSEYKGWNLVANSWMAPLQIDKMTTDDFGTGADATIYLYNSGSYADWDNYDGNYLSGQYAPAGQYTTIPVGATKILNEAGDTDLPSTIAPMQAFFVLTSTNTTLLLKYNDLVFNDDYTQTTTPMRAPRRAQVQKDDVSVLRIDVKGEYAADKMWIMQDNRFSLGYDNGYDGKKILGESFVPQLAVATQDGEMAIAAIPEYEGTKLMFRRGSEDELYTLSFRYTGTPLLLRDLKTGAEVEILTGNSYSFYATNEELEERFEIVKKPNAEGGIASGLTAVVDGDGLQIENATGGPVMVSVYTPEGRLIQQFNTIEMSYKLNLSMTGVYVVRLQSANECKIVKVIR